MSDNTTEVEDFDVKYWFFKILGFWYLFLLAFIISTGIARLYLRYTEKTYRVSTSILVSDESSSNDLGIDGLIGLGGRGGGFGGSGIESEISVIQSFDLIQSTLKKLNFQVAYFFRGDIKDSEIYGKEVPIRVQLLDFEGQTNNNIFFDFNGEGSFGVFLEASEKKWQCDFGKPCTSESFSFVVSVKNKSKLKNYTEPFYMKIYDLNRLTVRYMNMLNVDNRESKTFVRFGSNIIDIDIAGKVIEKSTAFLNALTKAFMEYDLEERNSTANRTISFIDRQLNSISDSLVRVENGLENFRAEKGIIDLSSRGELLLTELTRLEGERSVIDLTAKYYGFLSNYLKSSDSGDQVVSPNTAGITEPTLVGLIGELNLLISEHVQQSVTEGDSSILLREVENQITSVKARIHESIRNGLEGNEISYRQIDDQLINLRSQISELPKNERDLLTIQRRFNLNNELYTFLLKKKSETEIARAGNKPKVKVLDEARGLQAALLGPQPKKIYVMANALGFSLIFGILVVRFLLQNKITEVEQVKEQGKITVLGRIPHIRSKRRKASAIILPKNPFSEVFRAIRLNLDFVVPKKEEAKVIGLTSAESGEGKTFSALNLAQVCAVSGKKTLLIGMDLRKPKLQEELTLANSEGLSNYLVGNAELEGIIQECDIKFLDVIASGPIPPNPAELFSSERFKILIESLSEKYDYIICDGAPMGLVTDYMSAAPYMDTTLYVVRLKHSRLKATHLLAENVSRGLIKSAHILVNDVGERASKKYGYGYGYGYGEEIGKKNLWARVFKR